MELLAKTCNYERMNVQRLTARLFVAAGGLFWMAAAFGASFSYQDKPLVESVGTALIPIGIAIIALALGWFYEVLTAVILFAGAAGVVVWGVVAGWEPGVWIVMLAVLAAPMAIAGVLYLLAARMQNTCSLEEAGI
jgi:hypothetical protein